MKRFFRSTACLAGLFALLLSAQAFAAPKTTFIVAPFSVQGPDSFAYLQRSIPQMLTSRIYWKDRVEPARALPDSVKPVASEAEAEKLRAQYKADYIIWGTVTVVGEMCSLDVRVRDKAGKIWPQAREARAPQLIAAITGVSDAINRDVFGRAPQPMSAGGGAPAGAVNQMNTDIQINQTTSQDVYLNPQFRYSGASAEDDSRLRSQPLNFPSIGMEVVDADGDGKNEVFILQERAIGAYRFTGARLDPIGEFKFPINHKALNVRSIQHPSGRPWIIVTLVDQRGQPSSQILTYSGGQFTVMMKNIKFYLNVAKLAPSYKDTVIGQQAMPPRLFRPGVYEMIPQGGTLVQGQKLDLPPDANVFNFAYLPGSRGDKAGQKLMVLSESEQIRAYGPNNNRISTTSEKYSGSATGLEIDPSMPGLHRDDVTIASVFYIPMRMLAMDLERDGNWDILVNKPISTASEIFDRYRFFPQAEIHSLYWDGLGLSMKWKTRRIKGSMVDYTIADVNNDGVPDLVVCLNTHPGALGVKARKTVVVLYPLDLNRADPATKPDMSDIHN